jgi:hypothetical protein
MVRAASEADAGIPGDEAREERRREAERAARKASVLSLLRQGEISAGCAAELLGRERWQLGEVKCDQGMARLDDMMNPEEPEARESSVG